MPIYEYQCPNCQKVFEEWTHVTDMQAQEPCPDCGTPSPRVMSHTSFVLKGGGWYVSDYGYRKGIKDENSTSTPSSASPSTSPTSSGSTASSTSGGSAPAAASSSSTPSA
ncbi:zinc ribbon domain-containing protein [uncultured Desulfovibrio sp.]|uniref:FmdB family zinc ribbon protein n=1 Tax=uncultured Desulfovibrio sp. TaxID=167968 RepID=UPI00280504BF|nr:zinc ribbon domain-containing protein [uncultured Desulfovibrio sp.]